MLLHVRDASDACTQAAEAEYRQLLMDRSSHLAGRMHTAPEVTVPGLSRRRGQVRNVRSFTIIAD